MDYKKRYKEALERARELSKTVTGANYEYIFPELNESKDERIRNSLLSHIRNTRCVTEEGAEQVRSWIAWLEKQGEQPTDKVEPKFEPQFKVGDWITDGYIYYKITEILDDRYIIESKYDKSGAILFEHENRYHLWTIEDAKDGDVLVGKENLPFIFTGEFDVQNGNPTAYCGINCDDKFMTGKGSHWTFKDGIKPATKEQHELLFEKMTEAEYKWDTKKKEVKKIEVVSKESEDERIRKEIIDFVKSRGGFKGDWIAWLEEQGKENNTYIINNTPNCGISVYVNEELKESEDERIKETLKEFVKGYSAFINGQWRLGDFTVNRLIDWLEKQGEKKSTLPKWKYKKDNIPLLRDSLILNKYGCVGKSPSGAIVSDVWVLDYDELAKLPKEELEKQGEQPTDKVEPKFKLRDWIVDYVGNYWRVVKVRPNYYELEGDDGVKTRPTRKYVDEKYHLWTINDAKKGDILVVDGIWIVEFDKKMTDGCSWKKASILTSFEYDMDDDICTTGSHMFYKEIWPASKEDIDLFKKKRNEYLACNSHNEPKFKVGDKV